MKIGKAWRLALAVPLLLSGCMAVPPAAPAPSLPAGAPPTAGAAAAGAAAAAPASSPPNLWSFLCPTAEQKQECRQKLCNSFIGKMLSSMFAPLRLLTGGSSVCDQLAIKQGMAMPADSPQGAASRIKQEEAAAEARRQDVRYLGTVDCRYWPEAEGALIKALRSDPNECVRWEAATALNRGCCCTRPILEALVITVSGSDKDGAPAERSERVKAAALGALHHCLESCAATTVAPAPTPTRPEVPTPPEKPAPAEKAAPPQQLPDAAKPALPPPGAPGVIQAGYYQNLGRGMDPQLLEEARRLDSQYPPWPHRGENGLFGLLLEVQDRPIRTPTLPATAPSPSAEPPLIPVPNVADDAPKP